MKLGANSSKRKQDKQTFGPQREKKRNAQISQNKDERGEIIIDVSEI